MTNGHSAGNSVGIDDDIGCDALAREGHVLLAIEDTAGTLLTVAGGKFVTDLWSLGGTHPHFAELVTLIVPRYHDLIDDAVLAATHENARVTLRVTTLAAIHLKLRKKCYCKETSRKGGVEKIVAG